MNLRAAFFACLCSILTLSSCQRNSCDFWEDSKTASRHMTRGIKALGGKQGDSRQIASTEEFLGQPRRQDFIPLEDETAFRQLSMGEVGSLEEFNGSQGLPQAKDSPGDPGSPIPGIDQFKDPLHDAQLAQIFRNLHFPYNSSLLKGQDNMDRLRTISQYMKQYPSTYLFIEGHCDQRGPQAYNLALGTRRANSVRNFLVQEGIDLNRLFTISYGKERPIAQGNDEKAWQENRRAQFKTYQRGR